MNKERLQKVLARAGIASRRHAEQLIVAGHVRVNGHVVTELGLRVDAHHDKVEVDGKRIVLESPVYAIMNKPRGVVTTLSDPEGRPTIAEHVKSLGARVFPIGRLDFHTSGALLVTNDGDLAQALLHPRQHVPKVYVAKVRGAPTDGQLDAWRNGVVLAPTESDPDERRVKTLPAEVQVLRLAPPGEDSTTGAGATWLQVTLHEGRTRQIHRMADATGLFVMRLVRMSFADITTEGLRPGDLRELTDKEVTALRVKYLRPLEQGGEPKSIERPEERPARSTRPVRRDAERPRQFGSERSAPAAAERRPTREGASRPSRGSDDRPRERKDVERPTSARNERPTRPSAGRSSEARPSEARPSENQRAPRSRDARPTRPTTVRPTRAEAPRPPRAAPPRPTRAPIDERPHVAKTSRAPERETAARASAPRGDRREEKTRPKPRGRS